MTLVSDSWQPRHDNSCQTHTTILVCYRFIQKSVAPQISYSGDSLGGSTVGFFDNYSLGVSTEHHVQE